MSTPNVCNSKIRLRLRTTVVASHAATRTRRRGTKLPMTSGRPDKYSKAIIGTGSTRLSTTWLMTNASVAFTPQSTTTNAGSIVTTRRTHSGMRMWTKSCMIVCPAMVPTTELAMPEASSDAMNAPAAATPINGSKVHYEVKGTGPDLILIHGALGNLRDMTFDLRDKLTNRYRVIAFDRPGFGYSDPLPNGDASLIGQALLLQKAAKEIGVTNPIVMGHSYGGAVAMSWAVHPDILPPADTGLCGARIYGWLDQLTGVEAGRGATADTQFRQPTH